MKKSINAEFDLFKSQKQTKSMDFWIPSTGFLLLFKVRILPWDSSPSLNHHLGMFDFFHPPEASKSEGFFEVHVPFWGLIFEHQA